jgi:hypothetical protein
LHIELFQYGAKLTASLPIAASVDSTMDGSGRARGRMTSLDGVID